MARRSAERGSERRQPQEPEPGLEKAGGRRDAGGILQGALVLFQGAGHLVFRFQGGAGRCDPADAERQYVPGYPELEQGVDYTYDEKTATVTLKADFINKGFEEKDGYGVFAQLTFRFNSTARRSAGSPLTPGRKRRVPIPAVGSTWSTSMLTWWRIMPSS